MKHKLISEKEFDINTIEHSFYDYIYTHSMPKKVENYINKFHQASTFVRPITSVNDSLDRNIINWLKAVERTDVMPEYYECEVRMNSPHLSVKGSCRNYSQDKSFNFEELSILMNQSFGRDESSLSKRYASAGGLYPVVPLLIVFKAFADLGCGAYVYNGDRKSLLKIKSWTIEEGARVKRESCMDSEELPNTCIAYAVDIRRAILKYHLRGYRHALIEVGSMSHVFKQTLHELKENVGEICWSGFNDNQMTVSCGLNVRLCPIVLLQFFGHK